VAAQLLSATHARIQRVQSARFLLSRWKHPYFSWLGPLQRNCSHDFHLCCIIHHFRCENEDLTTFYRIGCHYVVIRARVSSLDRGGLQRWVSLFVLIFEIVFAFQSCSSAIQSFLFSDLRLCWFFVEIYCWNWFIKVVHICLESIPWLECLGSIFCR